MGNLFTSPQQPGTVTPKRPLFSLATFVAISSNVIYGCNWVDFVLKHWDLIVAKNSKILIISGTHGAPDGKLWRTMRMEDGSMIDADQFVEEDEKHVEKIKKLKAGDIAKKKITFEVLDIWKFGRAEEDIKETLEKDKAELTSAIETNLEDTTKAVVMLRKELNDAIGSEKEQRKSQETQLKANLESLQVEKASQ